MSLGVSFAISPRQSSELLALEDDAARMEWLEALEEDEAATDSLDFDKAWDPLHRCLGDGSLVVINDGPLGVPHAVFGSRALMEDEDSPVFAGLLPADDVPAVAGALADVDRDWLLEGYKRLDPADHGGELGNEDFEYVAGALADLQAFLARAAQGGSAVVFTVAD